MKPLSYLDAWNLERSIGVSTPFSFLHRSPITGHIFQMTNVGGGRFINADHWLIYYVMNQAAQKTFGANE